MTKLRNWIETHELARSLEYLQLSKNAKQRIRKYIRHDLRCNYCGYGGSANIRWVILVHKETQGIIPLFWHPERSKYVRLTYDHIIPRSNPMRPAHNNIQILCAICNGKKGSMSHEKAFKLLKK